MSKAGTNFIQKTFDTVTIITGKNTDKILKSTFEKVNLRKVNEKTLSVAFDEAKRIDHVNLLLEIFGINKNIKKTIDIKLDNLPKSLLRTSKYLFTQSLTNTIPKLK